MTERPILFSGPMVKAILDGRKTQTRRVIKAQPSDAGLKRIETPEGFSAWHDWLLTLDEGSNRVCPHGRTGECLWVRETWRLCGVYDGYTSAQVKEHGDAIGQDNILFAADGDVEGFKWRPSIFMPRWASRIDLEIVSVRVQRVQEISDEDAVAEGVPNKAEYYALWNGLNEKRGYGWAINPWVWAIEFKRLRP